MQETGVPYRLGMYQAGSVTQQLPLYCSDLPHKPSIATPARAILSQEVQHKHQAAFLERVFARKLQQVKGRCNPSRICISQCRWHIDCMDQGLPGRAQLPSFDRGACSTSPGSKGLSARLRSMERGLMLFFLETQCGAVHWSSLGC